MSNPFQNVGRNAACLTVVAIASVVVVKSSLRNKKEARYTPQARVTSNQEKPNDDYYQNIAEVRPGFPINEGENRERKSVYEGPGISRETRKKGDKLGFFDRWFS